MALTWFGLSLSSFSAEHKETCSESVAKLMQVFTSDYFWDNPLEFAWSVTELKADARAMGLCVVLWGRLLQMFTRGGLERYRHPGRWWSFQQWGPWEFTARLYRRQKNGLLHGREWALCNDGRWVKRNPVLNPVRNVSFTVTHMDTRPVARLPRHKRDGDFKQCR